MRIILSKCYRILVKDKHIPLKCNAFQWAPLSNNEICDCKLECKFPPGSGNNKSFIQQSNIVTQSIYLTKSYD